MKEQMYDLAEVVMTVKFSPSKDKPEDIGTRKYYNIRFLATVVEISDHYMTIECPSLIRHAAQLRGFGIEVSFVYNNQSYFFNAVIVDSDETGNLIINHPDHLEKRDRNDSFFMLINCSMN